MDPTLYRRSLETPFGRMHVAVAGDGVLVEIWLPNRGPMRESPEPPSRAAAAGMRTACAQLGEYFLGKRREFELPLDPHGSPFELGVWQRLRSIPYGATTSYGAIAAELGLTNGARAVGRANGANPIPLVIPCHRIIGMDGQLTGFGGGLPLKQALLELEGALVPQSVALELFPPNA